MRYNRGEVFPFYQPMFSYSSAIQMDVDLPEGAGGFLWRYENLGRRDIRQYHHHPELELNYVLRGTAVYLLGDRRYVLTEGALVWLFPGRSHLLTRRSPDLEMWIAVFRPDLVRGACRADDSAPLRAADPVGYFCRRLLPAHARRLVGLFEDVLTASGRPDRFNAGLAYALLTAWEAYGEADEAPPSADVHPAVQRAIQMLRDGGEGTTVGQVARHAGLSASRLSEVFRQETGMTLVEFRNRQRLDRFLTLYGRGHRVSMLEAALEAGFGSYLQFYRVFRQIMGCGPSEFRRHGHEEQS